MRRPWIALASNLLLWGGIVALLLVVSDRFAWLAAAVGGTAVYLMFRRFRRIRRWRALKTRVATRAKGAFRPGPESKGEAKKAGKAVVGALRRRADDAGDMAGRAARAWIGRRQEKGRRSPASPTEDGGQEPDEGGS